MKYISTGRVDSGGVRWYWGTPEDKARCIVGTGSWGAPQCSRKRGRGPGGFYCAQHAKAVAAPAEGREEAAP